ncbi:unnamed protein product [Notodromas monacha]|uniref:RING-type domain-containing protein n=1 Tax=Notodromas monacha TaxID=399045 RepID=A0A7R9BJH2_9CRUS|nr:unnamed protein product [Notodromas monacha]CAG0915104.1 unnamed protein product [Notodromas monacha]
MLLGVASHEPSHSTSTKEVGMSETVHEDWVGCWRCARDATIDPGVTLGLLDCGHILCAKCVPTEDKKDVHCPVCQRQSKFKSLERGEHPSNVMLFLNDPSTLLAPSISSFLKVTNFQNAHRKRKISILRKRNFFLMKRLEQFATEHQKLKQAYIAVEAKHRQVKEAYEELKIKSRESREEYKMNPRISRDHRGRNEAPVARNAWEDYRERTQTSMGVTDSVLDYGGISLTPDSFVDPYNIRRNASRTSVFDRSHNQYHSVANPVRGNYLRR